MSVSWIWSRSPFIVTTWPAIVGSPPAFFGSPEAAAPSSRKSTSSLFRMGPLMRRLPDRGVLRRRRPALFALIGVLSVLPQPLRGQEQAQVGALGAKDGRFRERFEALLLRDPPPDLLGQGWQLAADLGRPAVPLLWEMLRDEKSN